jgi:hypothetical protein
MTIGFNARILNEGHYQLVARFKWLSSIKRKASFDAFLVFDDSCITLLFFALCLTRAMDKGLRMHCRFVRLLTVQVAAYVQTAVDGIRINKGNMAQLAINGAFHKCT